MTRLLSPIHNFILGRTLELDKNYIKKAQTPDKQYAQTSTVRSFRFEQSVNGSSSVFFNNSLRQDVLEGANIQYTPPSHLYGNISVDLGISVFSNPDKTIYYIYSSSFRGGKLQMKRTNKLLRELIRDKPKHVILDLTDNPGGQLNVASHLLSYFLSKSHRIASYVRMRNPISKMPPEFNFISKERQKNFVKKARNHRRVKKVKGQHKLRVIKRSFGNPDYNGNLVVLIGPQTHSAATAVASVLNRKRNAKLIGYVNVGSTRTSCFAPSGSYHLPNTKVSVSIPETCFDRPKNSKQNDDLLIPDIEVSPLGINSAYLNSKILEAALDEIAGSIQ
ncbi:MAG: hypothetical protein GY761_17635 [Hyphomicrobiales bacterium]|nr:hypothetical protein [Hyphomicrobiales bacterium]